MFKPRFFLPKKSIDETNSLVHIVDKAVINQILRVLRLHVGDSLTVLDGLGNLYHCQLAIVNTRLVGAHIVACRKATGDEEVSISIALPLIKSDRFDWAVEKLTELGVSTVIPIVSEHTVVRHKSEGKLTRWQSIARESSEQCERATIPQVVSPIELEQLLSDQDKLHKTNSTLALICAERRGAPPLHDLLHIQAADKRTPQNILVIVGPEGGLTEREIALATRKSYQAVSLGPRILRSETAAIYAVGQIISIFGGYEKFDF